MQYFRMVWVVQFMQCFCFDLMDMFVGNVELFIYFFQCVVGVYVDIEMYMQYFCFMSGEVGQYVMCCCVQVFGGCRIQWQFEGGIFDEIFQM